MEFIRVKSAAPGVNAIKARLKQELASNKRVLWLICGGSGITAEVKILNALRKNAKTENLAILLMDERFGPVGHQESNWQQLLAAGANFAGLYALPVLSGPKKQLPETLKRYAKLTSVAIDAADVIIGQFGIGPDGHTAGILPRTKATKKTNQLVVGYKSPPFVRITMTQPALKKVDAAYVFAFGAAKKQALTDLHTNKKTLVQLPSKLFWQLPEAYIYNDQIGAKS